jgi:ribulose-phosphate 3-epimerase
VINPATPVSALEEALNWVDYVLVMSVNPGFGGQRFIDASLDKISRLEGMIKSRGLNVRIEVDGGIDVDNVADVVSRGARLIVAGSAVFWKGRSRSGDARTSTESVGAAHCLIRAHCR